MFIARKFFVGFHVWVIWQNLLKWTVISSIFVHGGIKCFVINCNQSLIFLFHVCKIWIKFYIFWILLMFIKIGRLTAATTYKKWIYAKRKIRFQLAMAQVYLFLLHSSVSHRQCIISAPFPFHAPCFSKGKVLSRRLKSFRLNILP